MMVNPVAVLMLVVVASCGGTLAFAPRSFGAARSTSLRMANPETSVFLTPETAKACIEIAGGSPLYAYSVEKLDQAANACLAFPNAFGLTVRYAMKACPNGSILKFFNSKGIHIDASSGYEVRLLDWCRSLV
jgi:diaminopimelate decarboxylase